jgi:bacteriocin-like protein
MNKPEQSETRIKTLNDRQLEQVVGGGAIPGDFNQDGDVRAPRAPGFSSDPLVLSDG